MARRRRTRISCELLTRILNEGSSCREPSDPLLGVQICAAHYHRPSDTIELLLEHPSFKDVPAGLEPSWEPKFVRKAACELVVAEKGFGE